MKKNICKERHRYAKIFSQLSPSQALEGRHKCAACAFEQGFSDALNGSKYRYEAIVQQLPYSQAGKVRHKDPEEAYTLGFKYGVSLQDQMESVI